MDGIQAIQSYVERLVTGDGRCMGMKALLLDSWTTQTVSCVYSQNQVLQREVYWVSRLDTPSAAMDEEDDDDEDEGDGEGDLNKKMKKKKTSHMKAVCFLRPTDTNAKLLARELARPRFAEYHLFFSGILSTGLLRLIAEADEFELVKQVQELYGDFLPVNEDLATLNCHYTLAMTAAAGTARATDFAQLYDRNRQGIEALLLALKRQPRTIRYQASSVWAQQMAGDLNQRIAADQTFHFRTPNTMLLILDRMDDPVTPLLSQWTYQAMVHELLGINNNRVLLKGAPNVPKDLEEVVLSSYQDAFFRNNRFANFGELGEAIQKLLKDYQKTTQNQSDNINTIEQMQNFMEKFPELRSQSHTVSKHVEIFGELARLVQLCSLMDISQFEQDLACTDDHNTHYKQLMDTLANPAVKVPDKLRLGLLYALRYEQSGNVSRVKAEMRKGGVPDELILLVDCILRYAGITLRGPGLYGIGTGNVMKKMTKSIMSSVQGVSNVYAQHVPLLMETLQAAAKGKLKHENYPLVLAKNINEEALIPDEIIVFMVGGVTYEEAAKVHEFNRGRTKVFLCGSTIHNSTSFLDELKALVRN